MKEKEANIAVCAALVFHHQILSQEFFSQSVVRTVWQKHQAKVFWNFCHETSTTREYIMNLRLDKETYMVLVDRLKLYIERERTGMRPSILVHKRVAMALRRYGSGGSGRTISWLFGVGESTCADTCLEVAQAICDEFGPEYLSTPTHKEMKRQAYLFENGRGFPMCVGARDGSPHSSLWSIWKKAFVVFQRLLFCGSTNSSWGRLSHFGCNNGSCWKLS